MNSVTGRLVRAGIRTSRAVTAVMVGALFGSALLAVPAAADPGPAQAAVVAGRANLADTGSSTAPWIIGAVIVLALGGGLYAWSRRRTSADGSGTPPAPPTD